MKFDKQEYIKEVLTALFEEQLKNSSFNDDSVVNFNVKISDILMNMNKDEDGANDFMKARMLINNPAFKILSDALGKVVNTYNKPIRNVER